MSPGLRRRVDAAAAAPGAAGSVVDSTAAAVAPSSPVSFCSLQALANPEALAGSVAAELMALQAGVVQGSRLLYDGLPVHSLGEGELCRAVYDHLMWPCIWDTPLL